MSIASDKVVGIYYTLKNGEGELLDERQEGDPLSFLHGRGQIVPGLEKKLDGCSVGDLVEVAVSPDEGYGDRDAAKVMVVGHDEVPDASSLEVGGALLAETPDGARMPLWVKAIDDKTITLDANHPLAGETLHFAVTVKDVRDATEEELAHGHVHGPGGHHH